MGWKDQLDPRLPVWRDFDCWLARLPDDRFPNCRDLNKLLSDDLTNQNGKRLVFRNSETLEPESYEHRIFTSGEISTRPDNWHDLFNALIWLRYPEIKSALNALHHQAGSASATGFRGPARDAYTLFDECGVIVYSTQTAPLQALSRRDWQQAFTDDTAELWGTTVHAAIFGHAMLEKYLNPYKSMTAKAVLVEIDAASGCLNRETNIRMLDHYLAEQLENTSLLSNPVELTPLPLAGIPGWWTSTSQSPDFYADHKVFRAPPADFAAATILKS